MRMMVVNLMISPIIPAELKKNVRIKRAATNAERPDETPKTIVLIKIGMSEISNFTNGKRGIIGKFINIANASDIITNMAFCTIFNNS
jgi:hypothetical protein